jgi:hypothetical protein
LARPAVATACRATSAAAASADCPRQCLRRTGDWQWMGKNDCYTAQNSKSKSTESPITFSIFRAFCSQTCPDTAFLSSNMKVSLAELKFLFETDLSKAIVSCERLLWESDYSSFDEYLADHQTKYPMHHCSTSISQPTIIFRCHTCEKKREAHICIDCYLHGNHAGHNVTFSKITSGSCGCGNLVHLSPQGFCDCHRPGSVENV